MRPCDYRPDGRPESGVEWMSALRRLSSMAGLAFQVYLLKGKIRSL